MTNKQAYAGLLERLVDPHFMNDADYMRSPESISETVKLMREERSEAAEAISSLLKRVGELEGAVRLFLAYDASDDESGVQMMLAYNDALEAARAALNSDAPLSIGEGDRG